MGDGLSRQAFNVSSCKVLFSGPRLDDVYVIFASEQLVLPVNHSTHCLTSIRLKALELCPISFQGLVTIFYYYDCVCIRRVVFYV